jgi:flagellin
MQTNKGALNMPQIINTNISSLTAQRNLNTSQSDQAQALERLSSGLRINSAKDDAAGLAISTRFTSQTRGLSVAIRNAGDGISLSQTAEGALGSISDNLQRVRELALQSANGTNSDSDREALNAEAQQLIAEITRTGDQTNFNGRNLLDGSFSSQFQIGANAGETIDVSINQLTADTIGAAETAGVSALGTGAALANGDLIINGIAIDPSQASSDTASFTDSSFSAIAKVAAINAKSDATGVTAEVIDNVASGSEMTAASTTGTLTLNGVDIDLATGGVNASDDRNAVVSAINARSDQTGVVASDGGDAGGVTLTAADGRNISVSFGGVGGDLSSASTGLTEGTSYGGYTLISKDGTDITIDGGNGTGTGDLSNSGLTEGVYSGREATLNTLERDQGISTTETAGTFTTGDLGLTGSTTVDATNNTIEVSVDGASFATLTLDSLYDPSANGGTGSVGTYDNAADLALHINNAIVNGANGDATANSALRDANGTALVTAAADGNGGITFTSATAGDGGSVVARTGTGNIAIPTDTVETTGTDADAAVEVMSFNFIFDGVNVLDTSAGSNTLEVTTNNGASGDLVLTTTSYTSAQTFADDLNALMDTDGIGTEVQARVSSDGLKVELYSVDPTVTSIALSPTSTPADEINHNYEAEQIQHLSNGDAVIVNPITAGFFDDVAAADSLTINVGGAGDVDVAFDAAAYAAYIVANPAEDVTGGDGTLATAIGVAAGDSAEAAQLLQSVFLSQAAGTGLIVQDVGGQTVISTTSGDGTVKISTGTTAIEAGAVMSTASALTAETVESISATAGTAVTGDFNVDADGNFLAANGEASPLVVTAGENDSFEVAVDGGASQSVTIAPGTYNSLSDLTTAINSGITAAAEKINFLDLSAATAESEYDFSAGTDDLIFDLKLNDGAAQTISITGDYEVTGDLAATQAALVSALQTEIDAAYGTGQVLVELSGTDVQLSSVVSGVSLEVDAVTDDDTPGLVGTSELISVVAAGTTNQPAYTASVTPGNQSLTFTSGTQSVTSEVDVTNGTFAIEGGFTNGADLTDQVTPNALEAGDLVINGTSIRAADGSDDTASDEEALTSDAAASGIATAAAINASSEQTGVTATVNATELNGGDGTGTKATTGTGTVHINGVSTSDIVISGDEDADRSATVDAINAIAGQTGVSAEDNGKSITLTAADGRNISVAVDNKGTADVGAALGLDSSSDGIGEADFTGGATYANTAGTTYSTVQLTSAGEIDVAAGDNGADELTAIGLKEGTYGAGDNGIFISEIDISTFAGANEAIVAIDNALNQVSAERANLGAIQNRFQSTISNLEITSENLTAANSRIRDADFAAETAALSRSQVLQQAGISILAQANALPQQALSLLQ